MILPLILYVNIAAQMWLVVGADEQLKKSTVLAHLGTHVVIELFKMFGYIVFLILKCVI